MVSKKHQYNFKIMGQKKNIIIAEIGSTHDGSLSLAKKSIRAAADSGADAVKFQLHVAEDETLTNAPSPHYFKNESRYDYFKRTSFNFKEWKQIANECKKNKVEFICSPFSFKSVDILEKLKVKKYKIPSGEVTNIPLLKKISKTGKEILLSTGMSSWKEINLAKKQFKKNKLLIMQCSSEYPCKLKNVGPNLFKDFKKKFINFGFSDHTLGCAASSIAAALGASVIEKHLLFQKNYMEVMQNFLWNRKSLRIF